MKDNQLVVHKDQKFITELTCIKQGGVFVCFKKVIFKDKINMQPHYYFINKTYPIEFLPNNSRISVLA